MSCFSARSMLRLVLTVVALSMLFAVTTASAAHSNPKVQKRNLRSIHLARQNGSIIPIIGDGLGDGNNDEGTTTTEPTTTPSPTTSTRQPPPPPPDTSTTTTSTSTTTSQTSTSTSSSQSTSTTTVANNNTSQRTSDTVVRQTYSYTPSSRSTSTRPAATTDADVEPPATPFLQNKGAVAATFTVVGLVAAGAVLFMVFHLRKRMNQEKNDDTWEDAASMAEFTSAGASSAAAGLGRSNTVLPSASSAVGGGANALYRAPSSHHTHQDYYPESTEEILAMPPVTNYERPRDSAYDIVPAAPPSAFNKPRRGQTTSFGSVVGNDPFAGTGFVDATRDSAYGPGEAGRGAAFAVYGSNYGAGTSGYNQQQQQPSYGYGQQQQQPGYGGGYGYTG